MATRTVRIFERETDDWAQIPVTQDDASWTGGWSYQIVSYGARPSGTWLPAVTNASQKGVDIAGLTTGYYDLYIRIDGLAGYAPIFKNADVFLIK